MRSKSIVLIMASVIVLSWSSSVFPLAEITHTAINEHIAKHVVNGFSLKDYLLNNLGFEKGETEVLSGDDADGNFQEKRIFEWLGYGGEQEDRPGSTMDYAKSVLDHRPIRSNNHFHNALCASVPSGTLPSGTQCSGGWENAGLHDSVEAGPIHVTVAAQSLILWAQSSEQDPDSNLGGNWSWKDARLYFYMGLTDTIQSLKEEYFAKTFRALGQQMHLVQDASVPAHVRNDIHLSPYYEGYVENIINTSTWDSLLNRPSVIFDKTILDRATQNTNAPVPTARIIDSDNYNGDNPDVTKSISGAQPIGIAEYANVNFLSHGTLFTSDAGHNFPYPKTSDLTKPQQKNNKRFYYSKTGSGDPIEYLAVSGLVDAHRMAYFPQDNERKPVYLDDRCYQEYAEKLIPRAVGYSAGLLNYFFRGTLEIYNPDGCLYSIIDGSKLPQQFTTIKAKVKNTTPNEAMQAGILQAVARYKKRADYEPDLSADDPLIPASRDEYFSYSVSKTVTLTADDITSLNGTTPKEFTFDFKNSPIPAGITDLYLQVIFKGTLGNEAGIAIAVGMKDLSEPMHHVHMNWTDRFYLDGVPMTAEDIRNDPTLYAKASASGRPIDSYPLRTEISFCPVAGHAPTVIYDAMPAGSFGRIITIVGADQTEFPLVVHRVSITPPDEKTTNFTSPIIVNQDVNGVFNPAAVYTMRGVKSHAGSTYANYYPDSTGILDAYWPVMLDLNPIIVTEINP